MRKGTEEFPYYTFRGDTSDHIVDEAFDDLQEIIREALNGLADPERASKLRSELSSALALALWSHWQDQLIALGEEEIISSE